MSKVIELTETEFDAVVLQSDVPVVVDFWSTSCGPCRLLVPVLEELAEDNGDEAKIAKVNVMENITLAARYGVDMLPTIMLFHKGNVAERMIGVVSKDRLQNALDQLNS